MAYITSDSGRREQYESGMQRDTTQDKVRFDLVSPLNIPYEEQMITRWAALMTRGAVKYGHRNWEKATGEEELDRFRESAFRHFLQWFLGADDGEDHGAAVFFNISGAELVRWKMRMGS